MIGLLTLSEQILCKKEVLGKAFECSIADEQVLIHFPLYPVIDDSDSWFGVGTPLLPPKIEREWKKGAFSLSWGFPMSHPAGDSCVKMLAITTQCEKSYTNTCAQKLYASIERWELAFVDHIKLETKQNIERDQNIQRDTCKFELFEDNYIPEKKTIRIYAIIPSAKTFASEKNILNAIAFADSGKELLLEYQMLLSAYEARRQNQNRRAILDACSAMEITLVDEINQYCQSIGLPPEILINKYRYLGERIDLLKTLDNGFPNEDYKALVINPRNAVMHNKTVFPSDEVTDKLISCVEGFLGHFHPSFY
ncbi:MAG: hypothetical protein IJK77_07865 [Lachnospiraceae bacterium]|nr:hypothetical protein [Lachnospiraceae bacterium]